MTKKRAAGRWQELGKALGKKSARELLSEIHDLYSLSQGNRDFLHARHLASDDGLDAYMKIIDDSLYPDVMGGKRIRLSTARAAIADYRKACGDPDGLLELMVFFVETGTRFTVEYGDIDSGFYSSLCSMFDSALAALQRSEPDLVSKFLPRLVTIRDSAEGRVGWSYPDHLREALAKAFPTATDAGQPAGGSARRGGKTRAARPR